MSAREIEILDIHTRPFETSEAQREKLTRRVWRASATTYKRIARSVMVRTTAGFFSRN
jgi:hypothetical protein